MGFFRRANAILSNVIGGILKKDVHHFIDVVAPASDSVLLTKTQSLLTVIRVEGYQSIAGKEEWQQVHAAAVSVVKAMFERAGHTLEFNFDYAPEFTGYYAEKAVEASRITVKNIGIDLEDLLDEQQKVIESNCNYEANYIALWTHPSVMDDYQSKEEKKNADSRNKDFGDISNHTANLTFLYESMMNTHQAAVESLISTMGDAGMMMHILNCDDACAAMKLQLEKSHCAIGWKPILFGSGKRLVRREMVHSTPEEVVAGVLPPRIDTQIATSVHEPEGPGILRIGDACYTNVYLDIYPEDVRRFGSLFRQLPKDIPFRMSVKLNHGVGLDVTYKRLVSIFFGWAHTTNKMIQRGINSLPEGDTGEEIGLQTVFTLSAASKEELIRNRSKFIRELQNWGNPQFVLDIADPGELHATSCVGSNPRSAATKAYPPAKDAVTMLPLLRPAALWQGGSLHFVTRDGKHWPMELGSSRQEAVAEGYIARPRQGKSVLSNAILTALVSKAGLIRTPLIGVVDIGPSSEGWISLMKSALPDHLKHWAIHHKLRNSPDEATNPLDIQLGLKRPLPVERNFIINFLYELMVDVGSPPIDGMRDFLSMLVDKAYTVLADRGMANLYSMGAEPEVDRVLPLCGIEPVQAETAKMSWWEIRDKLFDSGEVRMASIAQRHAVPTIPKLSEIVSSATDIQEQYGEKYFGGNLVELAKTKFNAIVREYALLSGVTKLDFDNARMIALDLKDAISGGDEKRVAVMYMLGRQLVAKNIYLTTDYVSLFDSKYQSYQRTRIGTIREDIKRVIYDEFYQTGSAPGVQRQIEFDLREGPKWGVQVGLITHFYKDLPGGIRDILTNLYVLGTPMAADLALLKANWDLSASAENALKRELRGPGPGGSTLMYLGRHKTGNYSQVLRFPKGPKELWAYNTTNQDMILRDELYERLGAKHARELLVKFFPFGTAMKEIERRAGERANGDDLADGAADTSIVMELVNELLSAA